MLYHAQGRLFNLIWWTWKLLVMPKLTQKLIVLSYNLSNCNVVLWCNVDSSFPRPFVPATQRLAVFAKLHTLSHPGTKATMKLITDRYICPLLKKTFVNGAACVKIARPQKLIVILSLVFPSKSQYPEDFKL